MATMAMESSAVHDEPKGPTLPQSTQMDRMGALEASTCSQLPSEACNASNRPKVLCLGISYPAVRTHMTAEGYSEERMEELLTPKQHDPYTPTELVVECVRRNILTEMDGRDLGRIWAMERACFVQAYCVSQESAASYHAQQHLHANFNRTASFVRALQQNFGKVRFRQIVLDYFWIPKGSWTMSHWAPSFFRGTLPKLVDFLEYPGDDEGAGSAAGCGVIYLPFCLHCMKELIASLDEIKKYYKISFVYQWELSEHLLWRGTQAIDATTMQQWLGKQRAQEEIYCTFTPRDVNEAMDHANVTKVELVRVLRGIEDFQSVRMIRLQPLRQHNPALKKVSAVVQSTVTVPSGRASRVRRSWRLCKQQNRKSRRSNKRVANDPTSSTNQDNEIGGFIGLLPPQKVTRGYDTLLSKPSEVASVDSTVDESVSSASSECDDSERVTHETCQLVDSTQSQTATRVGTVEAPSKRRRLFCPVPDLETYYKLGKKGQAQLTSDYSVEEHDHTIGVDPPKTLSPIGCFVDRLDLHEITQGIGSDEGNGKLVDGEMSFDSAALSSLHQELQVRHSDGVNAATSNPSPGSDRSKRYRKWCVHGDAKAKGDCGIPQGRTAVGTQTVQAKRVHSQESSLSDSGGTASFVEGHRPETGKMAEHAFNLREISVAEKTGEQSVHVVRQLATRRRPRRLEPTFVPNARRKQAIGRSLLETVAMSTAEEKPPLNVTPHSKHLSSEHSSVLMTVATSTTNEAGRKGITGDEHLSTAPFLNLVVRNIVLCEVTKEDQATLNLCRRLGDPGFACKNCSGSPGNGRFFPRVDEANVLDLPMLVNFFDHFTTSCKEVDPTLRKLLKKQRSLTNNRNLCEKTLRAYAPVMAEFHTLRARLRRMWETRYQQHQATTRHHSTHEAAEEIVLVQRNATSTRIDTSPKICSLIGLSSASGMLSSTQRRLRSSVKHLRKQTGK